LGGAALGFLVDLTSIGSGSLFAIALMHVFNLTGKEVVGTDSAHAFLLTTAAGLIHMSYGTVHFAAFFSLLLVSGPGVLTGSMLFCMMLQPCSLRHFGVYQHQRDYDHTTRNVTGDFPSAGVLSSHCHWKTPVG
jgi:uncharacterized membrane protein YfcA